MCGSTFNIWILSSALKKPNKSTISKPQSNFYWQIICHYGKYSPLAWAKHGTSQVAVLTAIFIWRTWLITVVRRRAWWASAFHLELGCIEWGKFWCKTPRVLIFGLTMFSCIKPERVWYNSISPYGNLEMYIMGYVFIERLVGWRQWLVFWGTYKCCTHLGRPSKFWFWLLPRTCNAPEHNK